MSRHRDSSFWSLPAIGAVLLAVAMGIGDSRASALTTDDPSEDLLAHENETETLDELAPGAEPVPEIGNESETEPGIWAFPVSGTSSYSASFGAPRSEGRTHKGIDIFADKLTPVVAAADGIVVTAAVSNGRAGVFVVLEHAARDRSFYIHLNNDTPGTDDGQVVGIADGIVPGVQVTAGTLIGFVGDSGNAESTPPHLHFEYHPTREGAIDPYHLLRAAEGHLEALGADPQIEQLPFTGSQSTTLAIGAALAIALGVALLVTSGRLQHEPVVAFVPSPRRVVLTPEQADRVLGLLDYFEAEARGSSIRHSNRTQAV